MNSVELPIRCTKAMKLLGWGRTKMTEVKTSLGLKHARFVLLSDLVKAHAAKGQTQRPESLPRQAAGKSRERSSKRARCIASLSVRERSFEPTTSPR